MKISLLNNTAFKFILVGIINTIVGTLVMLFMYNIIHTNYWISSAANYVVGSIVSYVLNKNFTFNYKEDNCQTKYKFIISILICYFLAYGVSKPIVTQLLNEFPVTYQENISLLVGMFIFVFLNYFSQKIYVFKQ